MLVSHAAPQSPSFSCFLRSAAFTTWTSGTTARKIAAGLVSVNWTVCRSTALVAPGATIVARSDGRALLEGEDALDAVAHVLGGDLGAVVELGAPAQLEGVGEAVGRHRVALGQPRLEHGRIVEPAVEAVVEVEPHRHAADVEGGVRVHRVVGALVGEHEPRLRDRRRRAWPPSARGSGRGRASARSGGRSWAASRGVAGLRCGGIVRHGRRRRQADRRPSPADSTGGPK